MTTAIPPSQTVNPLRQRTVEATPPRTPVTNGRTHENLNAQTQAVTANKPADKVELSQEAKKLAAKPTTPAPAKAPTPTEVATGKNVNEVI